MCTLQLPLAASLLRAWVLFLVTAASAEAEPGRLTAREPTYKETAAALRRAVRFFVERLSVNGGYVWRYSKKLDRRWGEREAGEREIWVQPPGTPTVGMALLRAYEATGDTYYLKAALRAGKALAWGQLESGGWTYSIEFSKRWRRRWLRRADAQAMPPQRRAARRNWTSFDDDTTQSALRFLMALSQTLARSPLGGPDEAIDEALQYGLDGLLRAQYPNGAWPQGYDGRGYQAARHPLKRALLPRTWPRTYPGARSYWLFYTFNDNCIVDCVKTLMVAARHYAQPRFRRAIDRAGAFILAARLPEPHPVWAQQYNFAMEPEWARRFEPPAAVSAESVGVLECLIELYLFTGDSAYLEPIPPALAWFDRVQLAPGLWARFYELGTNKPLYFTRNYELTYRDDDLPTHYSFKGSYGVERVRRLFAAVSRGGRTAALDRGRSPDDRTARRRLAPRVREVIRALDEEGRWVEGEMIRSQTFVRNVELLSEYLQLFPPSAR